MLHLFRIDYKKCLLAKLEILLIKVEIKYVQRITQHTSR